MNLLLIIVKLINLILVVLTKKFNFFYDLTSKFLLFYFQTISINFLCKIIYYVVFSFWFVHNPEQREYLLVCGLQHLIKRIKGVL